MSLAVRVCERACHWSCLCWWRGSGMDSLCPPPPTSSTAESCRRGSSRSAPFQNLWARFLREGSSWVMSSISSEFRIHFGKRVIFKWKLNRWSKFGPGFVYVLSVNWVKSRTRSLWLFCSNRVCVCVVASTRLMAWPTWVCVCAVCLLPWPSASWKICAGSSRPASTARWWPRRAGRTRSWTLVSVQKRSLSSMQSSLIQA